MGFNKGKTDMKADSEGLFINFFRKNCSPDNKYGNSGWTKIFPDNNRKQTMRMLRKLTYFDQTMRIKIQLDLKSLWRMFLVYGLMDLLIGNY